MDIDAKDGLIGRQVFNVLNEIYQRSDDHWIVNTNYILEKTSGKQSRGSNVKLDVNTQEYRHSKIGFVTSHLKSYLAFLEMKIPISYLTETVTVNGKEEIRYPMYASDSTMMYAMAEMAGNKRMFSLHELLYLHRKRSAGKNEKCHHLHQYYDYLWMKALPPLPMLESADDIPSVPAILEREKSIDTYSVEV